MSMPLQSEVPIEVEAQMLLSRGELKLRCKTFIFKPGSLRESDSNNLDTLIKNFDGKQIIKITSTVYDFKESRTTNVISKELVRVWYYA